MSEPSYVVHESEGRTGDRLAALEQAQAAARTAVVAALNTHASDSDVHTSAEERAAWNAATDALEAAVATLRGSDSGKSAREIAALAIAAWVADAPTSFDTLKEIADWIQNDTTGAAKMANDIEDLKSEKVDAADLAAVATSGSYNDLSDKPTIPAPVTIDPALSPTSENPVQNKVVTKALYTGFTEWVFSGVPDGWDVRYLIYEDGTWEIAIDDIQGNPHFENISNSIDATELIFVDHLDGEYTITASRHLVTPTKTSQLTNDGAPNGGGTPYATTAQIPTVPSAYASTPAMDGVGNAGSSTAWAKGDHVHPSDTSKANATDLPYAMVTPGEWTFSGLPSGATNVQMSFDDVDGWSIYFDIAGGSRTFSTGQGTAEDLVVVFDTYGEYGDITATRASLPGHLLDRAVNAVSVLTDTELALPALEHAGKARDFLVRLEISGSTVPTITFAAPTGETITYETDGDTFPVPDAEGNWLYSFTETAAGTFAVSLKKVNEVAEPQAQGGS